MNEVFEIGNGQACNSRTNDVCGTLDCMHDQKAVLIRQGGAMDKTFYDSRGFQHKEESETCGTLTAEQNNHIRGDTPLVMERTFDARGHGGGEICGTITGGHQSTVSDYTQLVQEQTVVRRLTPKEAERLQGFPDDWTDIGEWTDSKGRTRQSADGLRYKALGNSIALPYWQWLADRICAQLKESGVDNPTMASLFDGIGGFPLVFSRSGCIPVWASEIEEFPIAVTKKHFPERETEMKGKENELSERAYESKKPDGT